MNATTAGARLPLFDTLRGMAMVLMAIYHFCFDLDHFGIIDVNMSRDEFWLIFRAVIMTSFMGLVGVGLFLSSARYSSTKFWLRLARVAACAVVISVATYFLFGSRWTFFGALHFIVIATLLGPLLIRIPIACAVVGSAIVALPSLYQNAFFSQPIWILTGLSPMRPATEDFSPFAPWLGVVMLGVFVGFLARKRFSHLATFEVLSLSKLGHHSLVFYMTHQLVLFPIAWAISKIFA
ncbi:MAG: heparan-alpha-glucosaminide N-acetyltransferase [Bdellovibrionota bacterium]